MENRHWTIVQQILSKYPYQFYAYGSRVKGQARKYSDLDLCFYKEIPWNVLSHIQEDLENSNLPFKVDLVFWGWMSAEFQGLIKFDLVLVG
jgi:predicted nucleotidyltransferase